MINIVNLQDYKNARKYTHDRRWFLSIMDKVVGAVATDAAWLRRLPESSEEFAEYVKLCTLYIQASVEASKLKIRCIEQYGTAEEKAAFAQWRLDHPDEKLT
jgi:hypothetical protein